ncbi:cupin domain-containing protein [Streptomyces sp. NBC_01426]|uniref:cupin domain-containing protein n=1 Tax=unclassified Streptomyces TaxID=2593676 RepID=UPI002E323C57|nr:cupin domain-containing protein [Streptomyces sp. NBC_01426]
MGGRQATARRPGASGGPDLTGREIVIESGQCTGWHYHDVPLMAVVASGTLTRILDDGSVETHPVGATFVEPSGSDHVHLGRNLGSEPVVLHVTCALAEDARWSVATPAPFGATPCPCPGHAR